MISRSRVSNAGLGCISFSGTNGTIAGNTVYGCGGTAVSVSSGDTATLVSGGTVVADNHITNFSLIVRTYRPGIGFSGVGLHVVNNTVQRTAHGDASSVERMCCVLCAYPLL